LSESFAETPDEELVREIASGNAEALAELYRRHQGSVFRFAFQMSGNSVVADDMVQDTFLALTRAAARYRPSGAKFTTYLYGVVRNLTRRRLRDERRAADRRALHVVSHQPPAEEAIVEHDARQQTIQRVRDAVLSLPSRYREAVVLCDLHGHDYAVAAEIIGCPIGTVRSRLSRGRGMLGEKLGYTRERAEHA
jgi:RNA polymerase sigma-70 factor (ECF subfamily)